jgi:hypothetical protein
MEDLTYEVALAYLTLDERLDQFKQGLVLTAPRK